MGWRNFFRWRRKPARTLGLKEVFRGFQQVLAANNDVLALMGDLEEKLSGRLSLDLPELRRVIHTLDEHLARLVAALARMSGDRWPELDKTRRHLQALIQVRLAEHPPVPDTPLTLSLRQASPEALAALGGKAANLARLAQAGLAVPEGFVATARAYRQFLTLKIPGKAAALQEVIEARLARLDLADPTGVAQTARELQALILAQPLPAELHHELLTAARRLAPNGTRLVVRSSGSREEVTATFAGIYDSFLNVSAEEVPERWRQVVASHFSHRALAYFRDVGLEVAEAYMAVLVQRLIPARASGVLFTTDPESFRFDRLLVSAAWGLGPELVMSESNPDIYVVDKQSGRVLTSQVGHKARQLILQGDRLAAQILAPEVARTPVLTPRDLEELAQVALALEDLLAGPQDVEWVQDWQGRCHLVQCRPLRISRAQARRFLEEVGRECRAEVLLEAGIPGSLGVGAGPVFILTPERSQEEVPAGAVLVIPRTSPQLTPVLSRVTALVADVGSPTGHMALVAREYGIPALVDTFQATKILRPGEVVTVDGYNARIYRGRVEELVRFEERQRPHLLRSPGLERLRAVLDLIVPLTLVDFKSPKFRPENCRTYHDIAFFAHEKAMQVMFGLMDEVAAGRVPALRLLKLDTKLPLNLHLVDVGDGLASHENPVPPEDILSVPFKALWRGISHPDISWAGPVPVSVGGFLHVLGQSAIRPPEQFWDKTYAIVSRHYVNYACRLGYHYQSVDSYCGPTAADNYINFNFKGGAADELRRIRRAKFIALVVEALGFEVEQHLDVIRARYRKRPLEETLERLDLLGRLMAYVRQMDMLMSHDGMITLLAERFLAGHYERPGGPEDVAGPA
ncbi:MAG: hypothetical protein K6T55_11295 [Syntrophobacterales bacterium]|nr:hypothetical protein [Syntrophobacterales bacterium]